MLSAGSVFATVLASQWLVFFWDSYLQWRQYHLIAINAKYPTDLLDGIMDVESYTKARSYGLDRSKFGLISHVINQILFTIVLITNALPYVWTISGDYVPTTYQTASQTAMFILLTSIFNTIVMLPLSLYSTFVIEERHGFNKQTLKFYIVDQAKKFALGQVLMQPIVLLLVWIIESTGHMFFIYAWLFLVAVSIFITFIYHDYIAPLFDNYRPVPEGSPLRLAVEALCKEQGFPLGKLLIVDGSRRSAHSNAYFYGFWKNKKIVLYDTLLANDSDACIAGETPAESTKEGSEEAKKKSSGCTLPEVLGVLCHELGHWRLWHTIKQLVIGQVDVFVCLFFFAALMELDVFYQAFGFTNGHPTIIGLTIILQFILAPYHEAIGFAVTCLTRRFEFGADSFAVNTGRGVDLGSALIKLNKDNLGFPLADWLYSTFNYSHPPLLERLAAIRSQTAESSKTRAKSD